MIYLIFAAFFVLFSIWAFRHQNKVYDETFSLGLNEGFNYAFFGTQEIILRAFEQSGLKKDNSYYVMKKILTESDQLLRKFYPSVDFGPSVNDALSRVEADIVAQHTPFPNPGNNTLN